jgi:hypothetical protein
MKTIKVLNDEDGMFRDVEEEEKNRRRGERSRPIHKYIRFIPCQ